MDLKKLIESLQIFESTQDIDKPTVIRILTDVFNSLMQKKYGEKVKTDVIFNPEKGDFQLWRSRKIVPDDSEEVGDEDKISLSEAHKITKDFELGEEVAEEIPLHTFSRRALAQASKLLIEKKQTLENQKIYKKYKDQIGKLIIAEVHYITPQEVVLLDNKGKRNLLKLPLREQIPGERFKEGRYVKAIIHKTNFSKNNVEIILSRTTPLFLQRLLEEEIPEIAQGSVIIKKIVRRPGERAKIAVASLDDRIEPVGTCVGVRGSRINVINKEIGKEKIDIISYTDNLQLYITRALRPAKTRKIQENPDYISLFLDPDQLPLAIGSKGQNIDLASQLIGKHLKVYKDIEGDVFLEELSEKIDQQVIEQLKNLGLQTAQRVVGTSPKQLATATGLSEAAIVSLQLTLSQELDKRPL